MFKKRKKETGIAICQKCYREISKGGRYDDSYYPEEIRKYLKDEYFEYDVIKPFIDTLKTKKKVRFICQECDCEEIMPISMMHIRKICSTKPICRKCALKYAINSDRWREANSAAQKIAQNRPKVIEKQRGAQKRLMREDPLYVDKRRSKSYISGSIRGFRFDSSWELYYIAFCWESSLIKSISRFGQSIEYYDSEGIQRRYHPDFLVRYSDDKSKIVEVKGSKKYNNFIEKFNAAKKQFGARYVVYGKKELYNLGICFWKPTFLRNFYKEYRHEIRFDDNARTRKMKKRIEEWLR